MLSKNHFVQDSASLSCVSTRLEGPTFGPQDRGSLSFLSPLVMQHHEPLLESSDELHGNQLAWRIFSINLAQMRRFTRTLLATRRARVTVMKHLIGRDNFALQLQLTEEVGQPAPIT